MARASRVFASILHSERDHCTVLHVLSGITIPTPLVRYSSSKLASTFIRTQFSFGLIHVLSLSLFGEFFPMALILFAVIT
jgi:hypothetical protein